jgi:hypothetical protein
MLMFRTEIHSTTLNKINTSHIDKYFPIYTD